MWRGRAWASDQTRMAAPWGGHSHTTCLARAVVLRRARPRVLQLDLRARGVDLEALPEATRDRPLEDRPEHVAAPHPADRCVDPPLHVGLVLADPDSPRNLQEYVRGELHGVVVRRHANQER